MSGNNDDEIIEWHDPKPFGFVYTTDAGQRFLKSSSTGFATSDKALTTANCAIIDWTDGTNQISWNGGHRYFLSNFPRSFFKNGKEVLTDNNFIGGAYKNGLYVVFEYDGNIIASIKRGYDILFTITLDGTFYQFIHGVNINKACTQAAFIVYSATEETTVFYLDINLTDLTIVVNHTVVQDLSFTVPAPVDSAETFESMVDIGGGVISGTSVKVSTTSYSRAARRIIAAVDFDDSNDVVEFYIETAVNYSEIMTTKQGVTIGTDGTKTYNPLDTNRLVDIDNASTIDYNGIISGNTSYTAHSDDYHAGDHSEGDYHFILINDLDLRYHLFGYTDVVETDRTYTDGTANFSIARQYFLKIGTTNYSSFADYSHSYTDSEHQELCGSRIFHEGVSVIFKSLFEIVYWPDSSWLSILVKNNHLIDRFGNAIINHEPVIYNDFSTGLVKVGNEKMKITHSGAKTSITFTDLIGVI